MIDIRSGHAAIDRYLDAGYEKVRRMSSRFAAAICGHIVRRQTELGVRGDIAEIGTFEGRFFIALALAPPAFAQKNADTLRIEKDRPPIPRDFVQQPPLIPHSVKGYNITKNFNKCLDCHAWSRYEETGATKVSVTHFKDRDGKELANISPRRYFCTQCHVPQIDAKPLVESTFKRADGLRDTPANNK